MDNVWQPALLDPILDFLSEHLPAPLYSLVIRALSHLLAALTSISLLGLTLLSNSWNVQALLPPIVTILAAYLALASVYRTTTWMARTMFWFLKWGSLFGILMAGAGYFMGNAGNAVGNQGAVSMLAGLVANLFDDNSRTQGRRRPRQTRTRTKRPRAWDSFEVHKEWQYQQEDEQRDQAPDLQKLMNMFAGAAGQVLQGNWWSSARGESGDSTESGRQQQSTSKRDKAGRSRSR
ncbi:hypothetical protein CVT26_004915 [Gymnopilus dilepis]|uniref:Uncharacterized protein n=1 Tax=Gymnopilus dilepis TaxID=231916 RepID=A0A409YJ00_9AGAR|nr:hypothetical protein CVT26_004915 [Gymnopilus dilepis]